jgi:hypothetical protein
MIAQAAPALFQLPDAPQQPLLLLLLLPPLHQLLLQLPQTLHL